MAAIRTMKHFDEQKEPAALIFSNTAGSKIGAKNHLLNGDICFLIDCCVHRNKSPFHGIEKINSK